MPVVAGRWPLASKVGGNHGSEYYEPSADGFIRNVATPLSEHFFDVPQAECNASVKPDRMTYDSQREAVALEAERGISTLFFYGGAVNVTKPRYEYGVFPPMKQANRVPHRPLRFAFQSR